MDGEVRTLGSEIRGSPGFLYGCLSRTKPRRTLSPLGPRREVPPGLLGTDGSLCSRLPCRFQTRQLVLERSDRSCAQSCPNLGKNLPPRYARATVLAPVANEPSDGSFASADRNCRAQTPQSSFQVVFRSYVHQLRTVNHWLKRHETSQSPADHGSPLRGPS